MTYRLSPAQRLEQYFTLGQSRFHFLRQLNGRWHTRHILFGKVLFIPCDFLISPA